MTTMDHDRAIVAHHGFGCSETIDLKLGGALASADAGYSHGSSTRRLANRGTMLQDAESRLKALFVSGLDGDADAYRSFLQALTRHLRGYLRKRIPNYRDDVEDLVQEILLAVHNARHTYRADEPLTAWLHAIARYKLMDFFRSRARRESLNDPLDDHADLLADTDDEPAQARHDIGKLLAHLPDKQRLPIVHMKLEGLSVTETARITGLSESAVKVGVHRGLKALAALIRGLR
ncbi:RNA polymerase sigma-70 factor, ECF subfamily [Paraburkholderia diazotrophica]|uniref:RNA polymerase sigma-70 factor, ECF subfamily n=1 Tax=Paraburkholderia diazotrophica TaxID=667676 RepID=A0A1H7BD64_9BURK|nr:RNA polymerase sigma-70 factor, ECF subfamily [Paraburkholderia diazotrophica]